MSWKECVYFTTCTILKSYITYSKVFFNLMYFYKNHTREYCMCSQSQSHQATNKVNDNIILY